MISRAHVVWREAHQTENMGIWIERANQSGRSVVLVEISSTITYVTYYVLRYLASSLLEMLPACSFHFAVVCISFFLMFLQAI